MFVQQYSLYRMIINLPSFLTYVCRSLDTLSRTLNVQHMMHLLTNCCPRSGRKAEVAVIRCSIKRKHFKESLQLVRDAHIYCEINCRLKEHLFQTGIIHKIEDPNGTAT